MARDRSKRIDRRVVAAALAVAAAAVPAQGQTLELDKAVYDLADDIVATWTGGPGNATDWVGIYRPADVPGDIGSTRWFYTNGTRTAGGSFPGGSLTFADPGLDPGAYRAYFFANDGYSVLAGPVDFTVSAGPPVNPPAFVVPEIRRVHAVAGRPYGGTLRAYGRDADPGDPLTFAKTSGPAWLTVGADGALGGTPGVENVGTNVFGVAVADASGASDAAILTVEVFPAGAVHLPQLKVFAFNIWVGTNQVGDGYNKGIESVLLSDADLVAVCENRGRAGQWAAELGWHVFESGSDDAVLSRYPIVDTFTASASVGARVRLSEDPRREVVLWSVHLSAFPYGPYLARDTGGDNAAKVAAALAAEGNSGRVAQITNILASAEAQIAAADAVPVLIAGDFNTPSHLDWTPRTAASGLHFGLEIDWPVTVAMEEAGMTDAYRVIHRDPELVPGDTWSPVFTDDVQDRIDMVHFAGAPLTVTSAEVFTTVAIGRWPSDHSGVVATFHLDPVDADDDGLGDAWEVRHFGGTGAAAAGDDTDGDGRVNLVEYALGTAPAEPGRSERPGVKLGAPGGVGAGLTVTYRRVAGGAAEPGGTYVAGGLRYRLELSEDLVNWVPAGVLDPPSEVAALPGGVEESRFQLDPPVAETWFLRLRVERR